MTTKAVRILVAVAVVTLAIANASNSDARGRHHYRRTTQNASYNRVLVPAGTSLDVRLDAELSTEVVHPGESWTGKVTQDVVTGSGLAIPAGSAVEGVITSNSQGTHSTRPQMDLGLRSVTLNGQSRPFRADTPPIVAGSDRAKKIGVIAAGAAVGAVVGHTVAKDNHGTLIGGLLGGATSYGLTRNALRTMKLEAGSVLTFTVSENLLAQR